jgi:hypothetical protein
VTADRRLQVGGWAALFVAILLPFQFIAVRIWPITSEPSVVAGLVTLSSLASLATLGAAIGLHGVVRSIAPGQASRVLAFAIVGAGLDLGLVAGSWVVAGDRPGSGSGAIVGLELVADILVGLWFFVGGAVVMAGDRDLARIGWSGMIGGAAMILATFAVATRFGGSTAGGPDELPIRDWFHLLGLFVVLYLVRIWRYVVGGRLPAPGIL